MCHRDLATSPGHTYEISSTTPGPTPPTLPMPWLHHLLCVSTASLLEKHPLCSGRGLSTASHPSNRSPKRVLCLKQPHLRAAQCEPHAVAAAPSHDWIQVKETQCKGLSLSSLPLHNSMGCTQVTQLGFHPDHSWIVSRALLANTQAAEAPVYSGVIARMVPVGSGPAQSGLKT